MIKKIVFFALFALVLVVIISYSRGYRIKIGQNELTSNGLVAATSNPKSAKIFIDGVLKGVTDTTVYLQPGTYSFAIVKDGYFPWKKTISVKGEIVHSIDATLYPINSSLNPLTNIGVIKAIKFGAGEHKALVFSEAHSSSDDSLVGFTEQSPSQEKKDGLFVFDPNVRAVTIFSSLTSIAEYSTFPVEINPENVYVVFSPNYEQLILFNLDAEEKTSVHELEQKSEFEPNIVYPENYTSAFLLSVNSYNSSPLDITDSAPALIDAWSGQRKKNLDSLVSSYKKELGDFLASSSIILDVSQDKNRIMYQATSEAKLTQILKKPLIGANQTQEVRDIQIDNIYVYDVKEDRNYLVFAKDRLINDEIGNISFHPNSKNIVYRLANNLAIADYDAINEQKIYSGPFAKDFLEISNDGRLIILTTLNPTQNSSGDLYAIGIR